MNFLVYYQKEMRLQEQEYTISNIKETHVPVAVVEAYSVDQVYYKMQGEIWSPNGESRPLIEALGLKHTSMSVGDIIKIGDNYYIVDVFGFKKLEK